MDESLLVRRLDFGTRANFKIHMNIILLSFSKTIKLMTYFAPFLLVIIFS